MNSPAKWSSALDEQLLSRVEDASLNASAPPQQRWLDGWLVRYSPGKARRARCVNAVAEGRLALDHKLRMAAMVYREADLPLVVRITRFTQPGTLDQQLAGLGYALLDDTRVMVCPALSAASSVLPQGTRWQRLNAGQYAQAVGALRASPAEQVAAHAERLAHSPVPYQGWVIRRDTDEAVLACGQYAREADLVGLYDVYTRPDVRGRGLASLLCEHLLTAAYNEGASVGYLQVEGDNHVARRVYQRLGFVDGYSYHYRQAP